MSFFPRTRPPHHICDAEGRWWLLKESQSQYQYLSPPDEPEPTKPAYRLMSGGKPPPRRQRSASITDVTALSPNKGMAVCTGPKASPSKDNKDASPPQPSRRKSAADATTRKSACFRNSCSSDATLVEELDDVVTDA